jgi:hypothetical protein
MMHPRAQSSRAFQGMHLLHPGAPHFCQVTRRSLVVMVDGRWSMIGAGHG